MTLSGRPLRRLDTPALHARLAAVDAAMAARLRPSDRQRILRALEVHAATGRSLAAWQDDPPGAPLLRSERCLRLFLAPDRDGLRTRIEARFEAMIGAGALDEVDALARRGLDPALPVMRAHGVPWLIRHLRNEIGLDEAVAGAKADTRRYARRQFTWFRHQMPGWIFTTPDEAPQMLRRTARRGRLGAFGLIPTRSFIYAASRGSTPATLKFRPQTAKIHREGRKQDALEQPKRWRRPLGWRQWR